MEKVFKRIHDNSVYGCCIDSIINTVTYDGGWHYCSKRQRLAAQRKIKSLLKALGDDVVYCDTDGIKTVKERNDKA